MSKTSSLAAALLAGAAAAFAQAALAEPPAAPGVRAAFARPQDWTVTERDAATVMVSPEGDLSVTLVTVGEAGSAQAAALKARTLLAPHAARPVKLSSAEAPGEGWDERVAIEYETSPGEHAVAAAKALRSGNVWTVALVEGSEATANKRSAAVSTLEESLRPTGYVRESFAGRTAHRLTPDRVEALRAFVAASARELQIPGVGLALIDHDRVVWQGGVGVRELGRTEPVDAHTRFMIASNTKGMTTLLLSVLVDEGKLRWDQHVTDLYPAFRLGDEATTRAVLVRQLVCACTGLPRKDFAFILTDAGAPATDTFVQLAQTQPTSKFGELFQYNNLMASAAGYVAGSLAYPGVEIGAAYDRAMQTRIFDPLGMADTTFDMGRGESGDWARPHGFDVDGRMVEMPNGFNHLIGPYRPAGGAWSSAADMARYVQLELSRGVLPDGRRLVSEAALLERRKRGVAMGEDSWYGMGLIDRVDTGVEVVTHGGTLQGYHSDWYIVPDAQVGAVILTNADTGAQLLAPFLRRFLEVLYDGRPEAAGQVTAAAAHDAVANRVDRARLTYPGDPTLLAGLAPRYRNAEDRGTITLSERAGAPWIKAGFLEGPVATRRNPDGTISLVSAGPGVIKVDAVVGRQGDRRTLTIRDGQHDYVYVEVR